MKKNTKVVVVMGSKSDLSTMKDAVEVLRKFNVGTHTTILSAHRTPELLEREVKLWEDWGVEVIIAGAGGAAHLPGMLAAFSYLPVIGVPIQSKAINGLDSLLSIAQMPKGVPVATVAVGGAFNGGLLACQILSSKDKVLGSKLKAFKKQLNKKVKKDKKKLQNKGIKSFLK
jgi:phosphoribosylaminoimidazole carboxylase PurE protein